MKTEKKIFRFKGKNYSGNIVWPEDLDEALVLLGKYEVFKAFKIGYLEICRKQICGLTPRRKSHKIDLSQLPEQDQEAVAALVAELKLANQLRQQETESAPPEPQPTTPIDYVETQEEAQALTSEHASEFDQDFAKYLASLGSSLPPHTETAPQQPETAVNPPQSSPKGLLERLFG